MLISSGQVDLCSLQKLLTHESPAMTQRYSHLWDEALRKAVSVIDTCMDIDTAGKKAESLSLDGLPKNSK